MRELRHLAHLTVLTPHCRVFELPLEGKVLSPFMTQEFILMGANLTKEDLADLSALMESGKVTPVIDRRYKMSEAAAALRYIETGHARGKVVLIADRGK